MKVKRMSMMHWFSSIVKVQMKAKLKVSLAIFNCEGKSSLARTPSPSRYNFIQLKVKIFPLGLVEGCAGHFACLLWSRG